LDGLDKSSEEDVPPALIRFLWRYLDLLGVQPSAEFCAKCGEAFSADVSFDAKENGFVCGDCAPRPDDGIRPTREAMEYLRAVSSLEARESRKLELGADARVCLEQALFRLISWAAGERLKTLEFMP
jgi:DNA repair protein RecO (recombination protein O)